MGCLSHNGAGPEIQAGTKVATDFREGNLAARLALDPDRRQAIRGCSEKSGGKITKVVFQTPTAHRILGVLPNS
jgi:hypothetical protein